MPFDANDPDTKAALTAAVEEAVLASTTKLSTKNSELIAELREAKKGRQIDPEQHAKLEDKVGELEGLLSEAGKSASKAQKDFEKQLTEVSGKLQSESSYTQKLLVDNGLSDALVKAGVAAPLLPAVKAMLAAQVKVVADGDNRKAVVGDKPLSDFVTSWAQSDEGKHFVKAPDNTGGGAGGNSNTGGNGPKVISAGDSAAFGANLEAIAKGQAVVQ